MRRVPALSALAALAALALAAAACGGAPGPASTSPAPTATVIPVIVNAQQVVGPNRFVFSFLDARSNLPVAGPDRTASVSFIAPGQTSPGAAVPGAFVWAIEGSRGDYVAHVEFPSPGDWKAVFVTQAPGGQPESIGVGFQVADKGATVAVGQPAPASKTPTAADVAGDLGRIATDPHPDPAFYRLSVSQALAGHSPFVLVFATPAFCTSAQCGPTLDRVKAVAKAAPAGVAFINVEPYQLTYTDGRLQPVLDSAGQLQPVQAVNEWGILSEPWVFTVDRAGIIRGSFEGVVSADELTTAIAAIAQP